MKKHLSVLWLYLRATISKILIVVAVLAVVDIAGFGLLGFNKTWRLSKLDGNLFFYYAFMIAFIFAVSKYLIVFTDKGRGNPNCTLLRLRISERYLYIWHSIAVMLFVLLLWCAQILIIYAVAGIYSVDITYIEETKTAMANGNNFSFLSSLAAYNNISLWIRNIIFVFSTGVSCAYYSVRYRQYVKPAVLPSTVYISIATSGIRTETVYGNIFSSAITLILAILCIYNAIKIAEDGEQRYEYEEKDED